MKNTISPLIKEDNICYSNNWMIVVHYLVHYANSLSEWLFFLHASFSISICTFVDKGGEVIHLPWQFQWIAVFLIQVNMTGNLDCMCLCVPSSEEMTAALFWALSRFILLGGE